MTGFRRYAQQPNDGVLEIRYAKRGEHHLAYTLTGDGPFELVYMLGFVSHLDLLWDDPRAAALFARLGRFCRLVVMDKRGTGLSDRTGDVPIPEEQVDDLLAVMDAVGFERPAVLGTQDSFLVAALLAASRPERVSALVAVATGHTHRTTTGRPTYGTRSLKDSRSTGDDRKHPSTTGRLGCGERMPRSDAGGLGTAVLRRVRRARCASSATTSTQTCGRFSARSGSPASSWRVRTTSSTSGSVGRWPMASPTVGS